MKKINLFFYLLTVIAIISLAGCSNDDGVDVVNDITPVNNWSPAKLAVLDSLKNIPVANRQNYLQANWPSLSTDLVLFLKNRHKIPATTAIDSIVYKYGSAKEIKAEDGSGTVHEGYFDNQLVAYVYIKKSEKPLTILVRCTNGLFSLPEDLKYVKTDTQFEFTIEKTKGIAYYVGTNETAINLAEHFGLNLYKGKGVNKKRLISPSQARLINTSEIQLTVLVYTGDYFNLNTMAYISTKNQPPKITAY